MFRLRAICRQTLASTTSTYSALPRRSVAVIQDLDQRPVGSLWGDVNANTHRALGVQGVVTSGGVRDLDGVHKMGFFFFARDILVSHAYVHMVDFGTAVEVGGVTVRSR